jgi:bifunctional DNA-binding transcriptional regulator/antitoxin component of YhaV-PrlF toxin-antitoxin module
MKTIILKVSEEGISISSEVRKELGLKVGNELVARIEGDRLILENPKTTLADLKNLFVDCDISLADELIAERRAEAVNE